MTSVFVITLGFAPARILRQSFEALYRTKNPDLHFEHYFVNQHYPVNRLRNISDCLEICDFHGVKWINPGRNLGLHDGFNWALQQIDPPPGSIIIAYDPDVNPISQGWDMALVRAIRGDPEQKVVWSSLSHEVAREELLAKGWDLHSADGYITLLMVKQPVMNSICAWSYDWLKSVGGLSEPGPWYGHLEAAMFDKLGDKRWAFLPGWHEDETFRHQQDEEYKIYKWELAHKKSTVLDFESWLKAGSPTTEG